MKKKRKVICRFCNKKFNFSLKHRVYCSIKCNEKGSVIRRHEWYLDHKELVLKRTKNNPNKPQIDRKAALKRLYGITLKQYNQIALKQHGLCNICKQPNKHFYVDHNHRTGKVRGLLCQTCNSALGFFNDSVHILKAAIKHLKQ